METQESNSGKKIEYEKDVMRLVKFLNEKLSKMKNNDFTLREISDAFSIVKSGIFDARVDNELSQDEIFEIDKEYIAKEQKLTVEWYVELYVKSKSKSKEVD